MSLNREFTLICSNEGTTLQTLAVEQFTLVNSHHQSFADEEM